MAHQETQELILSQMFDRSMTIMQPTFEAILSGANEEQEESFESYMQEAKNEWLEMMSKYLSKSEINSLVQAFFHTSQIDQQKLLMFNTVYTQRAVELAEKHF
tara:strand:- start:16212 stop:16520 length:309 start_codon:yes stop_codon:yes gene_type:complete